jgi:hypothetical protein
MATGPDHYAEAEQLLAHASRKSRIDDAKWLNTPQRRAELRAEAAVHATLALAAATALGPHEYPTYSRSDDSGWLDAAGWGSPKAGA